MTTSSTPTGAVEGTSSTVSIALAWLAVGIPLVWGVWQTAVKSMALFK